MSKIGLATALNSARDYEGTSELYRSSIPVITEDTAIEVFTSPLLNVPVLFNEFADVLIQRIVYTKFYNKLFRNPLKVLEGDELPVGYLGQEIFTNPAIGRDYDPNDFAGALRKYESDVKVQYQGINFDKQYPVTVIRNKLKQAFVSWSALEEYINSLTNSLYNGYYIDEYNNTKAIVTRAYLSNAVQIETLDAPTDTAKAKAFVKKARTLFLNFQTPSSQYNAWSKVGGYGRSIETFTNAEDIVLLVKNEIRSELDVEALATAFNMDKTTLMGNILPVNDFSIYDRATGTLLLDGSKILAIIADKSWFRIKQQDLYMDDFKNANNRSINYYLNAVKLFNYSYFADAVVFATEQPSTPITALDFGKESLTIKNEGTNVSIPVIATPAQANTPTIEYTSSDSDVFTVTADTNNNKLAIVTPVGDGTATLTATAGNVTKTLSITITDSSGT